MKNKKGWVVILAVCMLYGAVSVYAKPGTTDDPLVSKSYVDDKMEEIKAYVQTSIASGQTGNTDNGPVSVAGGQYVPVKGEVGQQIIGAEGTEIILRSGDAQVYASGENGLVNITLGVESYNGANLQHNHLYIVPRGDGRGVVVRSEAWFIIKGEYSIR